jgi:hypothetical protein
VKVILARTERTGYGIFSSVTKAKEIIGEKEGGEMFDPSYWSFDEFEIDVEELFDL